MLSCFFRFFTTISTIRIIIKRRVYEVSITPSPIQMPSSKRLKNRSAGGMSLNANLMMINTNAITAASFTCFFIDVPPLIVKTSLILRGKYYFTYSSRKIEQWTVSVNTPFTILFFRNTPSRCIPRRVNNFPDASLRTSYCA